MLSSAVVRASTHSGKNLRDELNVISMFRFPFAFSKGHIRIPRLRKPE
jgi:hypothetical protein